MELLESYLIVMKDREKLRIGYTYMLTQLMSNFGYQTTLVVYIMQLISLSWLCTQQAFHLKVHHFHLYNDYVAIRKGHMDGGSIDLGSYL